MFSVHRMVNISASVHYILTNAALSSDQVLTSNNQDDSLIITTLNTPSALYSQLWYFSVANESYYRLHTVDKGDMNCLDMNNYYDHQSLDLHFYYNDDAKYGQFWSFSDASNGAVRLSNSYMGSDLKLEVDPNDLSLKMKGGDSDGQDWILSPADSNGKLAATTTGSPSGSSVTPTATTLRTSVSLKSCASSATACSSGAATATGSLSPTSTPAPQEGKKKLSSGEIAGIAIGAAIGLAILIWFLWWLTKGTGMLSEKQPQSTAPRLY